MATIKKTAPKKSAAKPAKNAKRATWNTIIVFGYGETQIVSDVTHGRIPNIELKKIDSLMASLAKMQQLGTSVSLAETHSLNIFNGMFLDFRPAPSTKNKPQRFIWDEIDTRVVDAFAAEILAKVPPVKEKGDVMKMLLDNKLAKLARQKGDIKSKGHVSNKKSVKKKAVR